MRASSVLNDPTCSPLARLIIEEWTAMEARFARDSAGRGLSVVQVSKHLGPRDFQARPIAFTDRSALRAIASTMGWLERRGLLESSLDKRRRWKPREAMPATGVTCAAP